MRTFHFRSKPVRLLSVLALATALLYGCNKESELTSPQSSPSIAAYQNPPNVDDYGNLVFNDQAHFDEWVDFLDEQTSSEFMTQYNMEADAIYDEIESSLSGFSSFREYYQDQEDAAEAQGFSSLDDIPDYAFIKNPSIRSVLSENKTVVVGNDIYYWVNDTYVIIVENADYVKYEQILADPPIDNGQNSEYYLGYVASIEAVLAMGDDKTILELGATSGYSIIPYAETVPCNSYKRKYSITVADLSNTLNYQAYVVTIYWGDGTSSIISGAVNSGATSTTHTYASTGTYTITATIVYTLSGTDVVTPQTVEIISASCSRGGFSSPGHWQAYTDNNGKQYALRGSIYKDDSPLSKRVGANTKAYKKDGSTWKNLSANWVSVTIDAEVRDSDCSNMNTLLETDTDNSRHSLSASKANGQNYAEDDAIRSNHKMRAVSGGLIKEFNLCMDLCPTFVSHTCP